VELLSASHAVHEGLATLSFDAAVVAPVLDEFRQVGFLVEFVSLFSVALWAHSGFLEGLFGLGEAVFVVVVLTADALEHAGLAAPSIAVLADPDFESGGLDGWIFLLMFFLVSFDEGVDFKDELAGGEFLVMILKHLDEVVEVADERLVFLYGEAANVGWGSLLAFLYFLGHFE
jgi:hypothetical protein